MSQKVKKSVVFAALLACTGLTPAYANMFRTAGDASQDELSIPPMVPQNTAEGADNLGNHRAEEPLVMGGFGITGVGLPQPDPVAPGGYDPSAAVNVQFLSAVINGIEVPEYEPDNLGNHTATQILNMSGHAIINVADSYGGAGHQAVNIRTLNQYLAALPGPDNLGNHIATRTLNLNGNTIQLGSITSYDGSGNPVYGPGISISGTTITNLGSPVNATDAVNKTYVDNLVGGIDLSGYVTIAGAQTITGAKTFSAQIVASNGINLSNRKIVNVATPTANSDAANKAYVDAQIAGIPAGAIYTAGSGLILSGNTFAVDGTVVRTTGTQTIAGTKVFSGTIRVPTPATGPDAANKAYVDAQIAGIPAGAIYTAGSGLILSGNTFAVDGTVVRTTGTQTIAGAKTFSSAVTVATPTASGHATTKAYVDGLFSGVPSAPVYTAGTGLTLTGNTFAVNNTVVRTSGNQTIAGNKTFSSTINIAADTNQGIRFRAADNTVQSMIYGNATSMRLLAYATDGTTVASQLILLNDGRILPGTGRFDGGNQRITTVADPSAAQDAVNLRTLQAAVAAGGDNLGNHTATLNLNLNNNRIINVAAPINNTDAATKIYVDNLFAALPPGATYAAGSGLTLTGNIFSADSSVVRTSGTQSIAGAKTFTTALTVQTPTAAGHATTKAYVDAMVGGVTDTNTTYTAGAGLTLTGTVFSVNNTVVRTSGNQSIAGTKTFTSPIRVTNTFNIDGSGPGEQQNGLYLADLGTTAGTTLSPNMTAAIMGQISSTRSVGFTVDPSGYVYGFRSHSGVGPYTWQSKVRQADVATTLATPYTAGSGITVSGTNVIAVDATVIRSTGNQSIAGVKTFTGDIIVPTPTAPTEAANKAYVDSLISALPPGATYGAGDGLSLSGSTFAVNSTVVRTSGNQSIAGVKTFSGSIFVDGTGSTPDLVIRRTNSGANANMRFYTTGTGDVTIGQGDNTWFNVGSGDDIRYSATGATGVFGVNTTNGNVRWKGTATGVLNAANARLQAVATPTAGTDAANKAYVDAQIAAAPDANTTYAAGSGLSLSGTTFAVNNTVVRTTGNQSIAGTKNFTSGALQVTAAGTANAHLWLRGDSTNRALIYAGSTGTVVLRNYALDGTTIAGELAISSTGSIFPASGGFFNANGTRIQGLATPTAGTDAANKAYVDSRPDSNTTYAAGSGLSLSGTTFAVNNTVVRTTGNQTVAGTKTFSSPIMVSSTFNVNGSGPGEQQNGLYVADLGGTAGTTLSPNNTLAILAQTSSARSVGVTVAGGGYLYGFRSHSNAGTYTWESKVREADVANTLSNPYTGGSGVSISAANVVAVNNTVVRTTGNQSIAGVKTFTGDIIVPTPTAPTEAANKAYVDSRPDANTTYAAGNGLSLSGTTFAVNNTVVRTTGNQTIAGVKTFSGSINIDGTSNAPDLVIRRTNSAANANLRFYTTGTGDVTIGQGDNIWFNVGSGDDIRYSATGVFAVHTTNGNVRWKGTATGVLNAANARLQAVATPTAGTDAANKAYVDAQIAAAPDANTTYAAGSGLSLSGNTFSVNSTVVRTTGNQSIAGAKTFTSGSVYVSASGTSSSHLWLRGDSTNRAVLYATSGGNVVLRNYVADGSTSAGELIISSGGSIFPANGGFFNANGTRIQGLATPTAGTDAANKAYVDSRPDANTTYAAGSGLSLSGTTFAVNNTVVRTTGNQTVAGTKTFSSPIVVTNTFDVNGSGPGGQQNGLYVADLGGTAGTTLSPNNTLGIMAQTSAARSVGVTVDGAGYLYGFRSHSSAGTYTWQSKVREAQVANTLANPYTGGSGVSISSANVVAVNNTVVRTTGNQSIAGVKTFSGSINIDGTGNSPDLVIRRTNSGSNANLRFYTTGTGDVTIGQGDNTWFNVGSGDDIRYSATGVFGVNTTNGSVRWKGTATGVLNAANARLQAVATPTAGTDAANKAYVDSRPDANTTYAAGSGLSLSGTTFAVNNTVIRTTGNQTMDGVKTFNQPIDGTVAVKDTRTLAGSSGSASYIPTPDDLTSRAVTNLFSTGFTGNSWRSALMVKGWTNGNASWALSGPASTADNRWFLRSGLGTTWGADYEILHSGNINTFVNDTNTTYTAGSGLSLSGTTFAVNNTVVRTTGNQSIAGVKTFTGSINIDGTNSSPDLVVRRTNSGVNANMRFFTTGAGDVTLGQGDNGWFNVGSGNDIRWASGGTSTFAVQVSNGNIRWKGTATGNGSGITNLNANNLSTGTVAEARLPIRKASHTASGVLGYNGHTAAAGEFYGGATNPSGSTRVNYSGNFYATRMWSTAYYYFSDERLKKDIEMISPAEGTEIIKDLRPVSYTWKQDGKEALGVIAQEVQKVIPTAVIENEGGDLAVDYVQMIAPMVAAMQDMEARIAELEAELKAARAE